MQPYRPPRTFSHGESGVVTCFPLDGSTDVSDRGRLLAEIEFLTAYHPAAACVCVVIGTRPSLATLAKLFPHIQFLALDSPGAAEEYDPDRPEMQWPSNVSRFSGEMTKEYALHYGTRDKDSQCVLLLCSGESPERMTLWHTLIQPSRSLFLLRELAPDFLSGTMVYPVHSGARARACYLDAPPNAHCRVCYPAVWEEELAFFQMIIRVPGRYDLDAETAILHDYARGVLGYAPDGTRQTIEHVRMMLPPPP